MTDMIRVFEKLKLNMGEFKSIYKYAPVYKGILNDNPVVLKRTKQDPARGVKLIAFQHHLKASGVEVVTPIEHLGLSHHQVDDQRWTLYPFIQGEGYKGTLVQIEAAGEFLGKLHASSNNVFNHGFSFGKYDEEFIEDVIGDLVLARELYDFEPLYDSAIIEEMIQELSQLDLKYVDGTWDYKANNLVFGSKVTLVDTDNSGYIPRVVDLALACILFNTECDGAPDRPFIPSEWQVFMEGYNKHVELTDIEKSNFQAVLKFVFLDEGLYAMSDLEDDETDRQKNFIRNMLHIDFEKYYI